MTYIAYKTDEKITIDGRLDERAWDLAPKSPRFVDIVNGEPALYDTRAAVLWDDEYLYIGFWVEEPYIQAEISERDGIIFSENDVEVFIDGEDTYYEFEVNALNTIYEVFYIWKDVYESENKYHVPEFDINKRNAYTFGGNYDRNPKYFWNGSHPRGIRWAFTDWDFPNIKSAVHINGNLNDNTKIDKGWTVEIAFPWSGMKWLANGRSLPPKEKDIWNLQFARYEKLISLNQNVGWAWDPVGSEDNHKPERFTPIQFSQKNIYDLK